MKISPNWRAVGRVLRWARRQHGMTVERSRDRYSGERVITWWCGGDSVVIAFDGDTYQLGIGTEFNWLTDGHFESASAVLRVLAALDLIPAHLAEDTDERYGRCVRCGKLARWWNDSPFFPRWVHVPPMSAVRPGVHRAQVSDIPTDLAEAGPAAAPTLEHDA